MMPDTDPDARPRLTVDWGRARGQRRPTQAATAAVLKSDGHGPGTEAFAETRQASRCGVFFTALSSEGARQRRLHPDVEIFARSPFLERDTALLVEHRFVSWFYDLAGVDRWVGVCRRRARAALHLATGIERLGFDEGQTARLPDDRRRRDALDLVRPGIGVYGYPLSLLPDCTTRPAGRHIRSLARAGSRRPRR